ncbi:sugar ABC transporter permease [Cohnella sp. CIP 111063]|uniref:carbohydrate ABC transporter permease n=1 Tax=unclassified Cohnella TaxID=2636738 RepID=UPI000B8C1370|nr:MULTISPECIES: carbohydrate ABC transporter permease [unclassified Cohnella]OXS57398.1 sugar ABC transporter permease [Cohnella sp. CIP 111063]PRX70844.1 carbohydrate ABC transporter membrane protein 2 (CUT1 family) [Cohnella sp. SGD-V74]
MKITRALVLAVISVAAVVFLFPLYVALLMALKTAKQTFDSFYALPPSLNLSNFSHAWETSDYPTAFLNSLIVTGLSVVLILVVSALSGYAIARGNKPIYTFFFMLFLSGMMVPFQVTMLPLYQLGKTFDLLNNYWGIVVIYGGFGVQSGVLFFTGFVRGVSREIEEAARIDGCSTPGIFIRIIMPLLKPVTATVLVLNALYIWNDFLLPLLYLQEKAYRTIPLQQYFFFGQYSSDLNLAFAYAVMGLIPIIVFFLFMQRFIVKGIAAGAVKG